MIEKNNSSRRLFIKQISLSTTGIATGKNLLFLQDRMEEEDGLNNSSEASYDSGKSVLIPVHVDVKPSTIKFTAGDETILFTGKLFDLDSDQRLHSDWSVSQREITTISLDVTAQAKTFLKSIHWLAGQWEEGVETEIHSTGIMDNMLFLRKNGVSFFISLDFPFSAIGSSGIAYPPNEFIEAGKKMAAHSLSLGACRLSGQKVGRFDRIEIEAASEYIERRFSVRFERPMFLSCAITNRMTDVRDGRIFYSTYDQPSISLKPQLVEKDLEICAKLGIEYYQVFEGVFDWPDKQKSGASYERLIKKSRSLKVKMGDYTSPQGLYCPHYNYGHRSVNRPDWLIIDSNGKAGPECLAVKEYQKLLKDSLIEHNRKYGTELICLDFLNIKPCYAKDHGHPPGDVYKQILALVDLMKSLNDLNPNFMVWSNSGNWIDLMPKLTWYNQNVYLTDPHIRKYSSHLNALKLLGDGRREQMVTVHESHFVPYRNFTNFEYYLTPGSRLSDTKIFEYSFLQGLGVTPNIGFGELRTFLNNIPSLDAERCKTFIEKWLKFLKTNYRVWKYTQRIGDVPGEGAAEMYAHIVKDEGFIVLINQNSFSKSAIFSLDDSIGLTAGDRYTLIEIYPDECYIAEQPMPYAKRNDSITCVMPANSVRIIRVSPGEAKEQPSLFGLPYKANKIDGGFRFTLTAAQGRKANVGLSLPEGMAIDKITARQTPSVPMYTFPVGIRTLQTKGNLAMLEIQFPRELAPRELTKWRIGSDKVEMELPSADGKRFLGALIHNAFSENYEIQLDVITKKAVVDLQRIIPESVTPHNKSQPPDLEIMTYTTSFDLPFIETFGVDRSSADDALIELAFADHQEVLAIEATLNRKKVPVRQYQNPKQPDYLTYYLEMAGNVKPGKVDLSLNVHYRK